MINRIEEVYDYVSFGTVIQEVKTHIRRGALGDLLKTTPAHTVSLLNCSSITTAEKILSGRADVILAGGAKLCRMHQSVTTRMRKRLIGAGKAMKKVHCGLKHFSKVFQ